jgi:hypothetical protein
MAARWPTILVLTLLTGCHSSGGDGGSSSSASPTSVPVPTQQSAGGMWASSTPNSPMSLMIAETGDLRVAVPPTGTSGPAFGYGAVVVIGNRVEGSFETRAITPSPTAPPGAELDCTVSGTVSTRISMQLTNVCVDSAGATTTTSLSFFYDPRYETDSSLAAIAGNYTLSVNSATNTLNINGDGTLFAMYNNGPRCTLNGTVSLIHSDFNLYRVEVQFSGCTGFVTQYEGATMTGFATRFVPGPPGQPAGSFQLLLTAVLNGRLEFISVLYTPV